MPRESLGFVFLGIDDHPHDARHRSPAVSVARRLCPRLGPSPFQQGFCGGDARTRRRVGIFHDLGQHRDGIFGMRAGQVADVFQIIRFVCFIRHGNKVAVSMQQNNRFARAGANYKRA